MAEAINTEHPPPNKEQTPTIPEAPAVSKRSLKRQRKLEQNAERKKKLRESEKEQKKANKERREKEKEAWFSGMTEEQRIAERERIALNKQQQQQLRQLTRERLANALTNGLRIVFDCSFDHLMNDKETVSLCRQLHYSYAFNKTLEKPCQIHITSMDGHRTAKRFEQIQGYAWKAHVHKEHFTEVFDSAEIVYLSADSPNEITEFKQSEVYIIGAFVDKNRHKGVTFEKAQSLNVRTARLPLDKHIQMNTVKVLTTNHVFEIIAKVQQSSDWAEAIHSTVPLRKTKKQKTENGTAEGNDDNSDSDEQSDEREHVDGIDQGSDDDGEGDGSGGGKGSGGEGKEDREK
eukprot:c2317_g1_i1.p1 GENE.c2317_g1_i1~~c2317_g1_i1.p1  ORF type:complete len:347 (+),score=96.02 c2317_g1_i1:23-1063(+)